MICRGEGMILCLFTNAQLGLFDEILVHFFNQKWVYVAMLSMMCVCVLFHGLGASADLQLFDLIA